MLPEISDSTEPARSRNAPVSCKNDFTGALTVYPVCRNGFRCAVGEELYEAGKIEEAIEEEI